MWSTVCAIFSKPSIKRASVYIFHYPNSKLRFDLQSQKTSCLLITIMSLLNIQRDKFVYRSDLKSSSTFLIKNFELHGNQLFLAEVVNLSLPEITTSTRIDITLQVLRNWEHLRCIVQSLLIVGVTITISNLLGPRSVGIQCARIYIECKKRLSNLLKDATTDVVTARPCVRCAIFRYFLWRMTNFVFWGLVKGF